MDLVVGDGGVGLRVVGGDGPVVVVREGGEVAVAVAGESAVRGKRGEGVGVHFARRRGCERAGRPFALWERQLSAESVVVRIILIKFLVCDNPKFLYPNQALWSTAHSTHYLVRPLRQYDNHLHYHAI